MQPDFGLKLISAPCTLTDMWLGVSSIVQYLLAPILWATIRLLRNALTVIISLHLFVIAIPAQAIPVDRITSIALSMLIIFFILSPDS